MAFVLEKCYNMEDISMSNKYGVISKFDCYGKPMVTVRIGCADHIMSQEDWCKVYRRNYQNKWNTRVNRNRFDKGYKKFKYY